MKGYTKPFTREELVAHARTVLAGHEDVAGICVNREDLGASTRYAADAMATIVAVLESYPLAAPANECVRIICDDLAERGGFREIVDAIGAVAWRDLREHLVNKLRSAVVFSEPLTRPELSRPTPPAENVGDNLEFA